VKIKIRCADKEARGAVTNICGKKKEKTEFEVLLCDIVSFADDCEID